MTGSRRPGKWFWACTAVAIAAAAAPAAVILAIRIPAVREAERGGLARPLAPSSGQAEDGPPVRRIRRVFDAFPPYFPFSVVSARDAAPLIAEDEFVLGVEIGGESRAYPLSRLGKPGREVVNDTLGGEPIAVTFCGLCESPLVFSREVDGRTLTFYVSGVLVESNMLIKDVETRSGWVQLLGEAVDGPLKGEELRPFPSTWTDWKTWRAEHPATTTVSFARGDEGAARARPGADAARKQGLVDALQWGLSRDGKARSWRFSELIHNPVINDSFAGVPLLILFDASTLGATGFDRRLDGKTLAFRRRGDELIDDESGSVWDPHSGLALRGPLEGRRLAPVAGVVSRSDAWQAFHPDGSAWAPEGTEPKPR
jgi:hypothetical protein